MDKYYAVIDTNVVVSAMIKFNSVPGTILELVFMDTIIPVLNDEILKEYREVLLRPKFHFKEDDVTTFLESMVRRSLVLEAEKINIELPDPKDIIFYQVVMEKRKTDDAYLVTGNIKHFPNETFIVTPRELLDIIVSEQ